MRLFELSESDDRRGGVGWTRKGLDVRWKPGVKMGLSQSAAQSSGRRELNFVTRRRGIDCSDTGTSTRCDAQAQDNVLPWLETC